MGNIVTPDQGYLPVPAAAGLISPYPWWLTVALVIWALLALLCCWLCLLLLLLRYCCRRCRHRQYANDAKSLRSKLFGSGKAQGDGNPYGGHGAGFPTAPLPPLPIYGGRGGYQQEIIDDEIYGHGRPYVGAGMESQSVGSSSESYSEEEVNLGVNEGAKKSRRTVKRFQPIALPADPPAKAVTENIETNVERNITKNYIINEERNYYIQQDPVVEAASPVHDQEVQRLPAPSVTTINMAAERLADDPSWEKTNPMSAANDPGNQKGNQRASSEIVASDPSVFNQNVKYEAQPNIFTHRPPTPVKPREPEEPIFVPNTRVESEEDHGSTTSEMSGHDSESIYETIRVFTPRKQPLAPLEDDDVYRTAGIDEVEFEIKDLIRSQKLVGRMGGDSYGDILSPNNLSRRHLTPRHSSASSSSTLNNLMPITASQSNGLNRPRDNEAKQEETVTETIQTQQIQTTFRQIGQRVDDSAFFIPLTSSSSMNQNGSQQQQPQQRLEEGSIFFPLTSSSSMNQNGSQQQRIDEGSIFMPLASASSSTMQQQPADDGIIFIPVSSTATLLPEEHLTLRDQREREY